MSSLSCWSNFLHACFSACPTLWCTQGITRLGFQKGSMGLSWEMWTAVQQEKRTWVMLEKEQHGGALYSFESLWPIPNSLSRKITPLTWNWISSSDLIRSPLLVLVYLPISNKSHGFFFFHFITRSKCYSPEEAKPNNANWWSWGRSCGGWAGVGICSASLWGSFWRKCHNVGNSWIKSS